MTFRLLPELKWKCKKALNNYFISYMLGDIKCIKSVQVWHTENVPLTRILHQHPPSWCGSWKTSWSFPFHSDYFLPHWSLNNLNSCSRAVQYFLKQFTLIAYTEHLKWIIHSPILIDHLQSTLHCASIPYLLTPWPLQSQVTLRTLQVEKEIRDEYS